jgi:hypothetical protein
MWVLRPRAVVTRVGAGQSRTHGSVDFSSERVWGTMQSKDTSSPRRP